MALFASPVLDNFNRANEAPLSAAAGWDTSNIIAPTFKEGRLAVVSNMAVGERNAGSTVNQNVQWSAASYGDCEAFFTLASLTSGLAAGSVFSQGGQYHVCLRCDLATRTGYSFQLLVSNTGNFSGYQVYRNNPAWAPTQTSFNLGSTANALLGVPFGGKIGARAWNIQGGGVMLEMWASGSAGWFNVFRYADYGVGALTAPGKIGIHLSDNTLQESVRAAAEDFSGGTIVAPSTTLQDIPGFTGGIHDLDSRVASKRIQAGLTGVVSARPQLARKAWLSPAAMPPESLPGHSGGGGISIF